MAPTESKPLGGEHGCLVGLGGKIPAPCPRRTHQVLPPRDTLEQKKVKKRYPPPRVQPLPPLPIHLKNCFFGAFGANVLCVPKGHVQGVSQVFTLNSISVKTESHK